MAPTIYLAGMLHVRTFVLHIFAIASAISTASAASEETLQSGAGQHLIRREVEIVAEQTKSINSHVTTGDAAVTEAASPHQRLQYRLHSKQMSCNQGQHFLWQGTDAQCRARCTSMVDCKYFTTYRGDYCEISGACTNETIASDHSAITFSTAAACDGILETLTCDMDATVDTKCNNIEYPCPDGQRPCFKLYDHDRTGVVGHKGKQLQISLHVGETKRVTRVDVVGTFLNDFTMESSKDNMNWTAIPGSFKSQGAAQPVAGGVEGSFFRLTWKDSDDSGSFFPGTKVFLKGC